LFKTLLSIRFAIPFQNSENIVLKCLVDVMYAHSEVNLIKYTFKELKLWLYTTIHFL
jgi:hypothetical protein